MSSKLVGILNITPDSFSDGGFYNDKDNALKQLTLLIEEGADVIDIGAISTRPRAVMPTAAEEIERFRAIIPLLGNCSAKISIDSPNFETIKYLANYIPISWVNDQSGFIDHRMIDLLIGTEIKLVIMHHTCLPADSTNIIDENLDAKQVVQEWLIKKANYLIEQGIKKEQIIIDPGIGFGKNAKQSWDIIKSAASFKNLGYPVLYGHSRKSFLNLITREDFAKRDLETVIISFYLAQQGIDFLRVHNISASRKALDIRLELK